MSTKSKAPKATKTNRSTARLPIRKRGQETAVASDPASAAAQINQLLDQIEALIPDLLPPDASKTQRIAQSAKYASVLVPPTIAAVTAYAPFQQHNLFDIAMGNAALDYNSQLHPITQRMAAITLSMSYSVNVKLAEAGDAALQVFHWAKRHAKKPEGAGARTYVAELQKFVDQKTGRRRNAQPPTIPSPNTPPTTPPKTPTTQGIMAHPLGKAAAVNHDDDEAILKRVREVAESD